MAVHRRHQVMARCLLQDPSRLIWGLTIFLLVSAGSVLHGPEVPVNTG